MKNINICKQQYEQRIKKILKEAKVLVDNITKQNYLYHINVLENENEGFKVGISKYGDAIYISLIYLHNGKEVFGTVFRYVFNNEVRGANEKPYKDIKHFQDDLKEDFLNLYLKYLCK